MGGISITDTAKLEAMIHTLTLVIKIGKYLPWIVLAFGVGNVILAVLNFMWWNNIAAGVFDSILAFGAFVFFGQLMRRHKIHRYEYRYTGRHLRRMKEIEEEERFVRRRSGETEAT